MLREREYHCQQLEVQLDHAKRQAEASDVESFRDWFKRTVLLEYNDYAGVMKSTTSTVTAAATDPIQDLIVTLLVQWREQVGYYPRGAMGPVSKSENKFLQRITNLVVESHAKCMSAVVTANELKKENHDLAIRLRVSTDRLENCMVYLNRYRCRAEVCERQMLNADIKKFECQNALSDFFRREVSDLSKRLRSQSNQLVQLTASNSSLQAELTTLRTENIALQVTFIVL